MLSIVAPGDGPKLVVTKKGRKLLELMEVEDLSGFAANFRTAPSAIRFVCEFIGSHDVRPGKIDPKSVGFTQAELCYQLNKAGIGHNRRLVQNAIGMLVKHGFVEGEEDDRPIEESPS